MLFLNFCHCDDVANQMPKGYTVSCVSYVDHVNDDVSNKSLI